MTQTLRSEAPIASVRAAVRKLAAASQEPVSVNAQFLVKVAGELGIRTDQDDPIARRHWRKFTGQVERSLEWLAVNGELVKGLGPRGRVYRTPSQQMAHSAAEAEQRARNQARLAERQRVYDELSLHGITVLSARGAEIRLDWDSWQKIIGALEVIAEMRSAG